MSRLRPPFPLPVAGFLAWTLFVWINRIRNVLEGDESFATRGTLAVVFVLLAIVAGALLWVRPAAGRAAVLALAAWTTGVWLVRAVAIAINPDHGVAFKVIHAVLAVVSIGLAAWAVAVLGGVSRSGSPSPRRPSRSTA